MPIVLDYRIENLDDHVGRDFGLTEPVKVSQALIDQFAQCSRDAQWIHVDVDRARASAMGTTIAHGLLTLSLTTAAQYELGVFPEDASQVLNYGLDKVRFLSPVPSGASVAIRVELTGVERKGSGRTLVRCRNTAYVADALERPVMVADALYMLVA
ncbi:MaoC family dehydratase [Ramlibacter sp. G-1-2-2]|uniref:MaoC family dehydratase n=1 Tax=Ramlibacter agri TaxID=2728837 RepID=A0A848HIR8_9BURK|nr:MaoC family dehydratase [Ramlibacter agri]NML48403.1 MaoC family dehydratase [Ramlibacter agri]